MAENNNNMAQDSLQHARQTASTSIKTAKAAKKVGKAAVKAGGKLISVFGWKVIAVGAAVLLLCAILTNAVPSTSFNSFTHYNENQLTEAEKGQLASSMVDLESAKDAEKRGVNVIGSVFKQQKANVYDKLEQICRDSHVDYETTLQYMESNFVEIGEEIFEETEPGYYTEEEYDAVSILSAYSLSVDNLGSERYIDEGYSSNVDAIEVSASQQEKAKTVYKILVNGGCTPEAACGILGNLQAESGFRTTAVSDDGYGSFGIAQWTGGRKTSLINYCRRNGYSHTSLEGQANYLLHEINTGSGFKNLSYCSWSGRFGYLNCSKVIPGYTHRGMTGKELKQLTSIEKVAVLWINHHERPAAGIYHNEETRIGYAKGFYEKFADIKVSEDTGGILTLGDKTQSGKKHWTVDMKDKLSNYLAGSTLYSINIDKDDNGKEIKYEAVVEGDRTDDLSDAVDDYKDDVKEDIIDNGSDNSTNNIKDYQDKTSDQYEEFKNSEAFQGHEARDEENRKEPEVDLTKKEFVQATVIKEEVEQIAINAFELDERKIVDLYGGSEISAQEIIRNMSYNSLALLHDINDPESSLIRSDEYGDMITDYTIGSELGNFKVHYYCGCNKENCVKDRKEQLAGFGGRLLSDRKRVKGVSCAASDIPVGTVLYMEDYGLLVVDDKLKSKYDNVIAIYIGNKHDNETLKAVQEVSAGKHKVNHVPDLYEANAKNMGQNTGKYIWPVPSTGYISSPFGWRIHPIYGTRKFHEGIDIADHTGVNIIAADGGKVTYAALNGGIDWGYGYLIIIKHNDTMETRYAHCSKMLVKSGQTVKKGQVIGKVGETGGVTGPHLHFEVRKNGKAVDPQKYVKYDKKSNR